MKPFSYLILALLHVLSEFASSKTNRYFLRDLLKGSHGSEDSKDASEESKEADDKPRVMRDVVCTFIVLLTKKHLDSMVEADGDYYPVRAYSFPERWWELAKARFVYTSASAVAKAKPYFHVDLGPGNVLTPVQVQRFFTEYNANQGDQYKVVLANPDAEHFCSGVSISDFKALCLGDDMVHFNESGTIDPEVAQVLGVVSPVSNPELVSRFNQVEGRVIERWLMSVE